MSLVSRGRIAAIAAALTLTAAAAHAQIADQPRYFEAPSGLVARAEPNDDAPTLSELGAGASPIEATAVEGVDFRWRRVVALEGVGWIAVDGLTELDPPRIGETALPVGLSCLGTEPFWSLDLDGPDQAVVSWPWSLDRTNFLTIENSLGAMARLGAPAAIGFRSGALLVVSAATCSDGMSDRLYPWSAVVIAADGGEAQLLSGCCRLPDAFQP